MRKKYSYMWNVTFSTLYRNYSNQKKRVLSIVSTTTSWIFEAQIVKTRERVPSFLAWSFQSLESLKIKKITLNNLSNKIIPNILWGGPIKFSHIYFCCYRRRKTPPSFKYNISFHGPSRSEGGVYVTSPYSQLCRHDIIVIANKRVAL